MGKNIRFCTNKDGDSIAYTTFGQGPWLVVPPGWISHIELQWELPGLNPFFDRLAKDHTLLFFDKHGTGLSDRNRTDFSLEKDRQDMEAVVDQVGVSEVDIFAFSMGGPLAVSYACKHPDRVRRLVLYGTFADGDRVAQDDLKASLISLVRVHWGMGSNLMSWLFIPDRQEDPLAQKQMSRYQRACASAEAASSFLECLYQIDVTGMLPAVRAPTLVIHRRGDRAIPSQLGRELAASISNAHFALVEGHIHFPWLEESERVLNLIQEFLGDEITHGDGSQTGRTEPPKAFLRDPSDNGYRKQERCAFEKVDRHEHASLAEQDAVSEVRGRYDIVYHDLLEQRPQVQRAVCRVGIAQIGRGVDLLEEKGNGLFGLRKSCVEDVLRGFEQMVESAAKNRIDLLLFPEMMIDMNHEELSRAVFEAASSFDMCIVPGGFHDFDTRSNVCRVVGPEGVLWEQKKHIPAMISLNGRRTREGILSGQTRRVTVCNTRFGRVAVTICRDFLDMDLRVELKNSAPPVDILLNPAFTPVTSDFASAHFEARRSLYACCFFCNVAEYGNSLIHTPEKGKRRRAISPQKESLIFKEIDLFRLRAERRRWERIKEDGTRYIQSTR